MIDLISEVGAALSNRPELISLLGGDFIWRHKVPEQFEKQFPRITFFEMSNFDDSYAEDAADSSEIHFQIDIWHTGATAKIGTQVDIAMKEAGFARYSGADLFEEDTNIYHKALRYRTVRRYEED